MLWRLLHDPPVIDPDWRKWKNGTVPRMARSIQEERRWSELPILADALEEAGCTSEHILSHLRDPGPHCRGCWVLYLVLGREQKP